MSPNRRHHHQPDLGSGAPGPRLRARRAGPAHSRTARREGNRARHRARRSRTRAGARSSGVGGGAGRGMGWRRHHQRSGSRARAAATIEGARPPDLGIIPGGSGNGLARELKIPFDPAARDRAGRSSAGTIDRCRRAGRPSVLQCGRHRARCACRGTRLNARASSRTPAVYQGEPRRSHPLSARHYTIEMTAGPNT